MSRAELRALDAWIATSFVPEKTWRILDGVLRTWSIDPQTGAPFTCPMFSTDPVAFALVRREIERRGWRISEKIAEALDPYFHFDIYYMDKIISSWKAEYEPLAGCLAVKMALENIS